MDNAHTQDNPAVGKPCVAGAIDIHVSHRKLRPKSLEKWSRIEFVTTARVMESVRPQRQFYYKVIFESLFYFSCAICNNVYISFIFLLRSSKKSFM